MDERYTAPALEKGLQILEIFASAPLPLTQKEVAETLGRSVGEIFRMLSVLERHGYVQRREDGRYQLSGRLMDLAHRQDPVRRLIAASASVLERLARTSVQSNYLGVPMGTDFSVVAKADPPIWRVLSVRLGALLPTVPESTTGLVLAAFGGSEREQAYLALVGDTPEVRERLSQVRRAGSALVPTDIVPGLTDICAPVFNGQGGCVAALSVNYLPHREVGPSLAVVHESVIAASTEITAALG